MKAQKKAGPLLGFLLLLGVLAAWLARPALVTEPARAGLRLCAQVIIPTLFPFFVLCNLFIRRGYHRYVSALLRPCMGPLFGLPPCAAGALALGMVGGYPVGADTAFRLYDRGELRDADTARLLCFCNNAGPGFVFGVVGMGLLGSAGAGALLYAIHLASALLVGAAAHLLSGAPPAARTAARAEDPSEGFAVSLVAAVREGADAMVHVCAFLVVFSVLAAFLHATALGAALTGLLGRLPGLDRPAAGALLGGLLELSGGVSALGGSALSRGALAVISSFLLGLGGLCVHCQTLSLRGSRPVSMAPYFLGKLAQGLLAAALTALILYRPAMGGVLLPALALLFLLLARRRKKTAGKIPADAL